MADIETARHHIGSEVIAGAFARRLRANAGHAEKQKFSVANLSTMSVADCRALADWIENAAALFGIIAMQVALDPDIGHIGLGHVCKHGVRWPHACDECDRAALGAQERANAEHRKGLSDSEKYLSGNRERVENAIPAPAADAAELVERLAQWLHDEVDYPDPHFPNYHWPEHPDDTGQREGGWLHIIPKDTQAQFRDIARRLATFIDKTTADALEALQAERDSLAEWRREASDTLVLQTRRAGAAEAERDAQRRKIEDLSVALAECERRLDADYQREDVAELIAERDALKAEVERKDGALRIADDAIAEYVRYLDGGELRGSYDGKPEREGLRKAGYALRAALTPAEARR